MSGNKYDMRLAYIDRRRKRRRKIIIRRFVCFFLVIGVLLGIVTGGISVYRKIQNARLLENAENIKMPDWVDVDLIHLHNTARSGIALSNIKNIVIHYVGNPGSTAQNNRDFFDNNDTTVSSHFVVGLEGEIIQCVPVSEKSAASNWRNNDTISIEVCHPDESGKFNDKTYESVVKLTAWLCNEFGLEKDDVIRHYDITGKICPKYFVDNEDSWEQFKTEVGKKKDEFKEK